MFKDVPDGNEIFLVFKNVVLIYSKKHFYKEFCLKFETSFESVSLRKRLRHDVYLDKMFDDVLERKGGFLNCKSVIFNIVR